MLFRWTSITRWLAAQKLGLAKVPVHIAEGLSEAQFKAYRLADNRTGEEAANRYERERREEKSSLRKEREDAVEALRSSTRISLDAALRLRRAGDVEGMRELLDGMEDAYQRAVEKAPDRPEVRRPTTCHPETPRC